MTWQIKVEDGLCWQSVRLTDVENKEEFADCCGDLYESMVEDLKRQKKLEAELNL